MQDSLPLENMLALGKGAFGQKDGVAHAPEDEQEQQG